MDPVTRRTFLQTTAAAATTLALPSLGKGWYALAAARLPATSSGSSASPTRSAARCWPRRSARAATSPISTSSTRSATGSSLEDGKVNRAYGQVDLGVGIRTVKGDQVGYGFTQQLDGEGDAGGRGHRRDDRQRRGYDAGRLAWPRARSATTTRSTACSATCRSSPSCRSCSRSTTSASPCSPLVIKVTAQLHDQQKRILVVTSDGAKAEDLQPRIYLTAMVVAEKDGRRERAGWNLGGRARFVVLHAGARRRDRRRARRAASWSCSRPCSRRPARCRSCSGPGVTGILLHEAIGHGMEADFNRKKHLDLRDDARPQGRRAVRHDRRRRHHPGPARLDQRRRRGHAGRSAPCWSTRAS